MDTACKILEVIPEIWDMQKSRAISRQLCDLYIEVCKLTRHAGVRSLALSNLKEGLDYLLSEGTSAADLPTNESLRELWEDIQSCDINPGLSYAALGVSGPIMAVFLARQQDGTEPMLRAWGQMVADALDAENVSIRLCAGMYVLY
jgi:hypothetical protein